MKVIFSRCALEYKHTNNQKQTPFLTFLIAQFTGGILGATIANGMFEVDGVFEGT
jgi:hypothetical protein